MPMIDSMLAELEQESEATRRVLDRVPADRLEWKPHPKSMSLGQLGLHVAGLPGGIAEMALGDGWEDPDFDDLPEPDDAESLLSTFEDGLRRAKELLGGMSDAQLAEPWRVTRDGEVLLEMPRAGLIRVILLNHMYHHRGQLCVYLRLLDVPVPAVYGASADERPLAEA